MTETKKRAQDAGEVEVDRAVDAEEDRGYRGFAPDPTPNDAYTLKGAASGEPTPETSPELRDRARVARELPVQVEHQPSDDKKRLVRELEKGGR